MEKYDMKNVSTRRFIVYEGISGSGKSALAEKTFWLLRKCGTDAMLAEEPSRNPVGTGIRKLITGQSFSRQELYDFSNAVVSVVPRIRYLRGESANVVDIRFGYFEKIVEGIPRKVESHAWLTEMEYQLLYLADRFLDLDRTIIPALARGTTVILVRYDLSTYAYGASRGIAMRDLYAFHKAVLGDHYLKPEITIFVDVAVRKAAERILKAGKRFDRFRGDYRNLKLIAKEYPYAIDFANSDGGDVCTVIGDMPIERVFEEVKRLLHAHQLLPFGV